MAHSATFRSFSVSQSSHMAPNSKRHLDPSSDESDRTPYPSDTDTRSSAHRNPAAKSRRPNDALGSYWAASSQSQSRKPGLKLQLPQRDEDEDTSYTSHRSHARPSRLQPSRHAQRPSLVSPISPTAVKKLGEMQLRPARENSPYARSSSNTPRKPISPVRGPEAQKWREWSGSVEEQLTDACAALRRAEAERQKEREKLEAEAMARYKTQRELEEVRRENRRLAARLEEVLKSPLSARGDDAWGCSMYDLEVDGH